MSVHIDAYSVFCGDALTSIFKTGDLKKKGF